MAGAIYAADGSVDTLAASRARVRTMVRGVRQGFHALAAAGRPIEPTKLDVLFRLPSIVPCTYWRRSLARPSAEPIFERRARAAPGEMLHLVKELRQIAPIAPDSAPELERLWAAVDVAAARAPTAMPFG